MTLSQEVIKEFEEIKKKEQELVRLQFSDCVPIIGGLEYFSRTNNFDFYELHAAANQVLLSVYNVLLFHAAYKFIHFLDHSTF